MRRVDWPLVRGVLALSLPTAGMVALGIWFMVEKVPVIVKTENQRVKEIYHAYAKELQSDRSLSISGNIGKRGKTWQMAPGTWGYKPAGNGKMFVWYSEKRKLWAREVEAVEAADFATVFWVCGTLAMLLLVVITAIGVHYFVDYVKARDDFVAETAHDLMTPLVVSRSFIGKDDAIALRANEQLIRIVGNLSEILVRGGRHAPVKPVKIDLPRLFDDAYSLFRDKYRAFSGGADIKKGGDLSLSAMGDETLVVQIFWNLISNGIKYAAKQGFAVKAVFVAEGDCAIVEISDTGPGMTSWERRRIFGRFYRSRKARRESGAGGFGIGLGNARAAARRMGGDLTVRANREGGSTFVFALPRR